MRTSSVSEMQATFKPRILPQTRSKLNRKNNKKDTDVCITQSITCLATDACLTADPGVRSSIPAWSDTFVEIDHEIISTVILFPSTESVKKVCCQLQAKVCARSTC